MEANIDGVAIHYEVTGDGPPVLLLHGFPDTGRVWRHQVPALADAGYRVVVPDLRGYGLSGQPPEVGSYAMPFLLADALGILDHLGARHATIVGHDWGAGIAWALAALHPERVDQLATLSVGHPAAFAAAGLAQREKSWYMLLFQFPGVAERWLSQDEWSNFRAWARHPDADAVIAELEVSHSLTPALNWYRANLPPETLLAGPPTLPPVHAPALGLWGSGDIALTEAQMTASKDHILGPWQYKRLDGVGHWMQLEAPDTVSRLLVEFLNRNESPRSR
jgi:pimeloyl-ACP methyl ester carboxylesterase